MTERTSQAGPPIDSPAYWERAERTAVSRDADVATAQVVRRMAELARSAASVPLLVEWAQSAVAQYKGGLGWVGCPIDPFRVPGLREQAIAESIWWWAHVYLKFEHHSRTIWNRLRELDQWQLLIAPDQLVQMWPMRGDCAIYSDLIAAFLEVWGIPWEFVTVAVDPQQPKVYSHVYVRAILPDGRRLSLDASHGKLPGWQVPAHDVFRLQVWDRSGSPVADAAPGQFYGLHNYSFRRRSRRGLADLLIDSGGGGAADDWQEGGSYYPPSGPNPTQVFFPGGGGSPGGGGGTNWGNVVSGLLKDWTQIGSRVLAPSTTYQRNPDGSISLVTPGSAGSSVLASSFGIGTSAIPTWVWVGGGLAVLVGVGAALKSGRR